MSTLGSVAMIGYIRERFGDAVADHLMQDCGTAKAVEGSTTYLLVRIPETETVEVYEVPADVAAQLVAEGVCGIELAMLMRREGHLPDDTTAAAIGDLVLNELDRRQQERQAEQQARQMVDQIMAMLGDGARVVVIGMDGGLYMPVDPTDPSGDQDDLFNDSRTSHLPPQ